MKKKVPSGSGVKPVKQYYLAPHLKFLDRFLKSRPAKGNIIEKPTSNRNEKLGADEDNLSVSEDEEPEPLPENKSETPFSPQSTNDLTEVTTPAAEVTDGSRKRKAPTLKEVNESALSYFQEKKKLLTNKSSEAMDPDMAFFQSLLPDVKAMNAKQKRKFKIGVLNLVGQIMDEDMSTSESVNRTPTPVHSSYYMSTTSTESHPQSIEESNITTDNNFQNSNFNLREFIHYGN